MAEQRELRRRSIQHPLSTPKRTPRTAPFPPRKTVRLAVPSALAFNGDTRWVQGFCAARTFSNSYPASYVLTATGYSAMETCES